MIVVSLGIWAISGLLDDEAESQGDSPDNVVAQADAKPADAAPAEDPSPSSRSQSEQEESTQRAISPKVKEKTERTTPADPPSAKSASTEKPDRKRPPQPIPGESQKLTPAASPKSPSKPQQKSKPQPPNPKTLAANRIRRSSSISLEDILPSEQAMAGKLTESLSLSDVSLADALTRFAKLAKVQIMIDRRALNEEGLSINEPVSVTADGTPAATLTAMLKNAGNGELTWLIENGVVVVTTTPQHDETLKTRIYQTRNPGREASDLAKGIQQTGLKLTWVNVDGTGGNMTTLGPRILVVRQTFHGLNQIENRFAKDLKPVELPEFSTNFKIEGGKSFAGLTKENSIDVIETPLAQAVTDLCQRAGAKCRVDEQALANEGISADEPVNLTLKELKTYQILNLLLDRLGLTWVPQPNGEIVITSRIAAEQNAITATHRIDARLGRNELFETLYEATSGPWASIDGVGGKIAVSGPNTIQVQQSHAVHREIARILTPFRKTKK